MRRKVHQRSTRVTRGQDTGGDSRGLDPVTYVETPVKPYYLRDGDLPQGMSNHVFWQWFDGLPREARAFMNAAANGSDFRWRFQRALAEFPPGVLTGTSERG